MRKTTLLAATAIILAAPLAAQSPMFDTGRLSQHVQTLGSDAFEGRGVATRAETKTVNYLVDQFKAAGLQPGGAIVDGKRGWIQPVPLLQSDWAGAPHLELNLNGQPLQLTQGSEIAARSPTNGDKGLNLNNVPLVFVGYGVKAP